MKSVDPATGALNLFFINKIDSTQSVDITISSANNYVSMAQLWQYKCTGPEDKNPTLGNTGSAKVSGNKVIGVNLPPTSITVVAISKNTGVPSALY
jgi:hypothetical protein